MIKKNEIETVEFQGRKYDFHCWYPIPTTEMDKQALLGEHHSIHGIWKVICSNNIELLLHPNIKRWLEHLDILYIRHKQIAIALRKSGSKHDSDLSQEDLLAAGYELEFRLNSKPKNPQPIALMRKALREKIESRKNKS